MKIGFTCGAFDLLHAGHINLFKQAKKNCDYLIVGLHFNPSVQRSDKNPPIENVLERQIKLYACKYVDQVVVYEGEADLATIFQYFQITIRFLGSDYKNIGKDISFEEMVPIKYIDSLSIHTSELRKRIKRS